MPKPTRVYRTTRRTPEEKARIEAIRDLYKDHPSREELIARGDIDPARSLPMAAHFALMRTFAALKAERERRGLSLETIAQRSGLDPTALARLESRDRQDPTFETIARYAKALGMEIHLELRDCQDSPAAEPALAAEPAGE